MELLSKKGVLFLTAGFHQPYVFQNITHVLEQKNDPHSLGTLKTVLSDGDIYISGVYVIKTKGELEKCLRIKDFDVLKLYATYESASKPV